MLKPIFVHIPKTGGKAIVAAFRDSIINDQHMPLSYYRSKYGKRASFFAFSRNPYDRLVSAYFYLLQGGTTRTDRADRDKYVGRRTFEEFVMALPEFYLEQQHLRPQIAYVRDCTDKNCIGQFEKLESDFHSFRQRYNISSGPLIKLNTSVHPPYHELYSHKMIEVVHTLYAEDFDYFDYPLTPSLEAAAQSLLPGIPANIELRACS